MTYLKPSKYPKIIPLSIQSPIEATVDISFNFEDFIPILYKFLCWSYNTSSPSLLLLRVCPHTLQTPFHGSLDCLITAAGPRIQQSGLSSSASKHLPPTAAAAAGPGSLCSTSRGSCLTTSCQKVEPAPLEEFSINSIPRAESTGFKHTNFTATFLPAAGAVTEWKVNAFTSNFFQLLPVSNNFQLFDKRKWRHSSRWILMRGGLQRLKKVLTDRALKWNARITHFLPLAP